MKRAYGAEGGAFPRAGDSALPSAPFCLGTGSIVPVEEENWSARKRGCRGQEDSVGFLLAWEQDITKRGTPPYTYPVQAAFVP